MVKMRALRPMYSGAVRYSVGETFEVENEHKARIFMRVGKAEFVKEEKAPTYRRRDIQAEPAKVETPTEVQPKPYQVQTMAKAGLVEMATGLGIALDGSETRADLIEKIEAKRAE